MPSFRIAHNLPADEVRRRMTARGEELCMLITRALDGHGIPCGGHVKADMRL